MKTTPIKLAKWACEVLAGGGGFLRSRSRPDLSLGMRDGYGLGTIALAWRDRNGFDIDSWAWNRLAIDFPFRQLNEEVLA
jgi:hypothetical protein